MTPGNVITVILIFLPVIATWLKNRVKFGGAQADMLTLTVAQAARLPGVEAQLQAALDRITELERLIHTMPSPEEFAAMKMNVGQFKAMLEESESEAARLRSSNKELKHLNADLSLQNQLVTEERNYFKAQAEAYAALLGEKMQRNPSANPPSVVVVENPS